MKKNKIRLLHIKSITIETLHDPLQKAVVFRDENYNCYLQYTETHSKVRKYTRTYRLSEQKFQRLKESSLVSLQRWYTPTEYELTPTERRAFLF